jgi:hypothetical protein
VPFANIKSDHGSVLVEFIAFGVLVQLPLMFMAVGLVTLQHDKLAAEGISREVLRSFVLSGQDPMITVAAVAEAYKVAPSRISLDLNCRPSACDSSAEWIRVTTKIGSAISTAVIRK